MFTIRILYNYSFCMNTILLVQHIINTMLVDLTVLLLMFIIIIIIIIIIIVNLHYDNTPIQIC